MRVEYYNLFHICMIFLPIIVFVLVYFPLKNKSDKTKTIALYILSSISIVLFVAYKIDMSLHYRGFRWVENLPLQLCNINILLIPIALATKSKTLSSFLFYVGVLGALVGVLMFDVYFIGRRAFSFPVIIYFFYHSILIVFPILMVAFKKYIPKFNDIWKSLGILSALLFLTHLVNLSLNSIFMIETVNYFYTLGMPGNPIMDLLWSIIPVPALFYLPLFPAILLVQMLLYLPFKLKRDRFVFKKEEGKVLNQS